MCPLRFPSVCTSDPRTGAAPRCDRESGFTLIELLVVMALLGVVLSLVGAGLVNLTRTTRSTQERGFADTALRQAMEIIARDLRAANPIDVHTPVSDYDRRMAFEIYCSTAGVGDCGADNLRQVVYRVQDNKLEVSRGGGAFVALLSPRVTSQLPVAARQFAVVNSASQPVFTFLKEDGTALATGGAAPNSPEQFRDCTRAVRIHLRMITEPGNTDAPADLTTTVTLRNFNEVSGC